MIKHYISLGYVCLALLQPVLTSSSAGIRDFPPLLHDRCTRVRRPVKSPESADTLSKRSSKTGLVYPSRPSPTHARHELLLWWNHQRARPECLACELSPTQSIIRLKTSSGRSSNSATSWYAHFNIAYCLTSADIPRPTSLDLSPSFTSPTSFTFDIANGESCSHSINLSPPNRQPPIATLKDGNILLSHQHPFQPCRHHIDIERVATSGRRVQTVGIVVTSLQRGRLLGLVTRMMMSIGVRVQMRYDMIIWLVFLLPPVFPHLLPLRPS
jgi:hypothetical protein